MSEYKLLGQSVVFDDAQERFWDLHIIQQKAMTSAALRFSNWYDQCKNIQVVIDNYPEFVKTQIEELAFQSLFPDLASYGIYEISQDTYWKHCVTFSKSDNELTAIARQLDAILEEQHEEAQYRSARKANRGRWQGGGFGMSGAITGAAKAGALNAASGLGHSIVNAAGNAVSAAVAASSKRKLYDADDTKKHLGNGLINDLRSFYQSHINLVNQIKGDFFRTTFNADKSSALLENAKNIPDKQNTLLLQAFSYCPWNKELIKFIFVNFPKDRRNIYSIACRCNIDLSKNVEDVLRREYDQSAQQSESAAQAAKVRIRNLMQEYGVTESETLNRLDKDCLERLCQNCQTADETECKSLLQAVTEYDTNSNIKKPYFTLLNKRLNELEIKRLEEFCKNWEIADESTCENLIKGLTELNAKEENKKVFFQRLHKRLNDLEIQKLENICSGYENLDEKSCEHIIEELTEYNAKEENKAIFLQKLENRIEAIHREEDQNDFRSLFMSLDFNNPKEIEDAKKYIKETGRTDASEEYMQALEYCAPNTVRNAILYNDGFLPKICKALMVICLILWVVLVEFAENLSCAFCFAGIAFGIWKHRLKKSWKILTLDNKISNQSLYVKRTAKMNSEIIFKIFLTFAIFASFSLVVSLSENKSEISEPQHNKLEISEPSPRSVDETNTNTFSESRAVEDVPADWSSTEEFNWEIETMNFDVTTCKFDAFCGIWESQDKNIQLNITASSEGYAISAFVVPWELQTETILMSPNIYDLPVEIYFVNGELTGEVSLRPISSSETLEFSYLFDRSYADPEKSKISGGKQPCVLLQKEQCPENVDYSRCLGWWMENKFGGSLYFNLTVLPDNNQKYGIQILSYGDSLNEGLFTDVIPLNIENEIASAEFDYGNGMYGEVYLQADRFGDLVMKNAVMYSNDGASLMFDITDSELVSPCVEEAEYVLRSYLQSFPIAVTVQDFREVSDLMIEGSPIYQQQEAVVNELAQKNISEYLIHCDIIDTEIIDKNHCRLTSEEIIEVCYPNDSVQEVHQSYKYTLELNPQVGWLLFDISEV